MAKKEAKKAVKANEKAKAQKKSTAKKVADYYEAESRQFSGCGD